MGCFVALLFLAGASRFPRARGGGAMGHGRVLREREKLEEDIEWRVSQGQMDATLAILGLS